MKIFGDGGNVPIVKKYGFNKLIGLGEGVASDEFIMTFEQHPNIQ